MSTCPMCAEPLQPGADKCPHCGESLVQPARATSPGRGSPYDVMQDKVGLVPNVRLKDNLIQAGVTAGAVLFGAVIGAIADGVEGALLGALGGLILGGLGSGFALMIVGLRRR